ncbi:solute carrier family 13 member 5 isoform X1 [Folsomia candida]|uniref:solute carrier family 13 member 5 isoform X1 n=2 Tax=Folsomia candida TaxID=158441 RepID=UPI001604F21F|nr:solute carrier family 13 member 5 isoform X1 [Folsomia candida]
MGKIGLVQRLARSWRFFAAIFIPIILLPLIIVPRDDQIIFNMAYAMLLMTFYWILELAPLPITALLPLLLFPMLGIQDIYAVSENYSKESNMIFLTGVIVAIGLEYCNLHRRIALRVMTLVGGTAVRLLLATMIITAILAMWLSSTTCAVLVLPTVVALIDEVNDSPVMMTKAEVRRKSRASGSTGDHFDRKLSTYSAAPNHLFRDRRRSTMFENSALVGPRRGSSPSISWNKLQTPRQSFSKINMHPNLISKNMESRATTPSGSVGNISGQPSPAPLRSKRVSILIHQSRNGDNTKDPYSGRGQSPENDEKSEDSRERSLSPQPHPSILIHNNPNFPYGNDFEEKKTESELEDEQKMKNNIKTMFLLGIAYAANIGGTAVITGAGPNKVFKEIIKPLNISQDGKYTNITFLSWALLQIPPMIVNVFIAWVYLSCTYQGISSLKRWFRGHESEEKVIYKWRSQQVNDYLVQEYEKLGTITYHEVAVGLIFLFVIFAWILREPELFSGWGDFYTGAKSGDSTGAMIGVVFLFLLPKSWEFLWGDSEDAEYEPLLDWKFTASKLPWSVLLLLGSGFAIADASDKSGLSEWLGNELGMLGDMPQGVLLLIVIVGTSAVTEVVSAYACANIILPIMISISKKLEIHPLYLTIPVAVSCSYTFMLPVGSPTNALVFAAGNFGSLHMARTGVFLNIICISVLYLNTITLGNYLFDFYNYDYPAYPDGGSNVTDSIMF